MDQYPKAPKFSDKAFKKVRHCEGFISLFTIFFNGNATDYKVLGSLILCTFWYFNHIYHIARPVVGEKSSKGSTGNAFVMRTYITHEE